MRGTFWYRENDYKKRVKYNIYQNTIYPPYTRILSHTHSTPLVSWYLVFRVWIVHTDSEYSWFNLRNSPTGSIPVECSFQPEEVKECQMGANVESYTAWREANGYPGSAGVSRSRVQNTTSGCWARVCPSATQTPRRRPRQSRDGIKQQQE